MWRPFIFLASALLAVSAHALPGLYGKPVLTGMWCPIDTDAFPEINARKWTSTSDHCPDQCEALSPTPYYCIFADGYCSYAKKDGLMCGHGNYQHPGAMVWSLEGHFGA